MRRPVLFLLILLLTGVEIWTWGQFRNAGDVSAQQLAALWTHLIVAALVAGLGSFTLSQVSFSTRVTLVILFFVIGAVLPVAGVLVVLALGWMLGTPAGTGERAEDKYIFGNPMAIAARHESRQPQPVLVPMCEHMRASNSLELEKMIHGLRHLRPSRLTLHFLRRFQTDPASNLQFASGGVITANLERLESQLKTITARLASNPTQLDAHLAAAEILLELAAWTPEGDATAQVYLEDARTHLKAAFKVDPSGQWARQLEVRALLGLDETTAATETLSKLTAPELKDSVILATMEAELRAGNYNNLRELGKKLTHIPSEAWEAVGFWTGQIEPPAALRLKR